MPRRVTTGLMGMRTVSGDEPVLVVLSTSNIGGRTMTENVARANLVGEGTVMTYDRAKIGVIIPVPTSRVDAFNALRAVDTYPLDRALKTDVRKRLLRGEIVGISCGRKKAVEEHIPEAIMVPYPHTVLIAEYLADLVWELVEGIEL